MKPWALWIALASPALLPVAGFSAAPGGRFQERLRQAERRFRASSAPRKPQVGPHRAVRVVPRRTSRAASRPASRAARRASTRTARRPVRRPRVVRRPAPCPPAAAPRVDEPIAAFSGQPADPAVTYSFEPRLPGRPLPPDTGDVLFSTFPRKLKVEFEFERGRTASSQGVLMQALEPQELRVRAYAPALRLEVVTTVPIRAGALTQVQIFFPQAVSRRRSP